MKLKEYAKKIAALAEKYPDFEVLYAIDDEGNAYMPVVHSPEVGQLDEDEWFDPDAKASDRNAICIN